VEGPLAPNPSILTPVSLKAPTMRLKRILILALAILIILLIVWRPWRNWGPDRASPEAPGMSPLVVFPFGTGGIDEDWRWLGTGLVDMFATRLNHLPPLRTVTLEQILEVTGPPSPGSGPGLSAEEALHHFQAEAALTGDISSLGTGFRLNIRLLGEKETEPLLEHYLVADGYDELFEAVDSLGNEVMEALGWTSPDPLPPIAQMTTPSLLAYRHYVMAVLDYIISDDASLPRATDHLKLAVAVDSTFARAHFLLAKVCDQARAMGIPQGSVEEPLAMANGFANRLPEWERQYARGWQLWLVQGDLDGAVAVLAELSERHRDYAWHEGVPLTLGRLLAHQGQWPQAIQQLRSYVGAEETPEIRKALGWGQLATAYQMTGDIAGSIEAVKMELSLFSGRPGNLYWRIQENMTLALLHFENEQTQLVEELLAQTEQLADGDARGLAMIGLTRFRMRQEKIAQALARKALRLEEDLAPAHYLQGLLFLQRKEHWRAVADLEAACSMEFNWDYLYHAGLAHSKRGDRQIAEELLELMVEFLGGEASQAVEPADLGMMGILLSRLGRYEEALAYGLRALQRYPCPQAKYDLASIYAIQGDRSKAMEWLRTAFNEGFLNRRQSRTDFNLENLWFDPDFILLTAGG
jgi:tetratricopeptide (TPR) repeat protein